MAIPRYDEIQFPALKLLNDGRERKLREFEEPLATHFGLTDEETGRMYQSGNGPIFRDRISWALSYLSMAGLVSKPKRGVYQINEEGLEMAKKPDELVSFIKGRIKDREPTRKKQDDGVLAEMDEQGSELTPEESLYKSYQEIRGAVYKEILDTILSKTPREFERLVVELLQKMGYGGEVHNAGLVTQYVNDKGIDGIIKEDILGFGRIHIQAKRYKIGNNVSREDIQKFVGALAVAQSDKGVFITTSDFTKGAKEYVEHLNSSATVVLMNGMDLAEHIYNHNLGMQTGRTLEIKKLDGDFWDRMQDD